MEDICFNSNPEFTRWVTNKGMLREPFVLVDVGVQGGASPRWDLLIDYIMVHGFDAVAEVVESLTQENAGRPNRHFHHIAVGNADEERTFYFNASNPTASSMYQQGATRFDLPMAEEARKVQVRQLDTLFANGTIPKADFLKVDVEGFESEVFQGGHKFLAAGVLGVETETNFSVSPTYPKGHFFTLAEQLIAHHLLVFDLGYNRVPRASFHRALAAKGCDPISEHQSIGKISTVNVLFCRDPINEKEHPECYLTPCPPLNVDQVIKMMIIYELYGLNDVAVDLAERFSDLLGTRLDVELATLLLANPYCRPEQDPQIRRIKEMEQSTSWRITAPMRAARELFSGNGRRSR